MSKVTAESLTTDDIRELSRHLAPGDILLHEAIRMALNPRTSGPTDCLSRRLIAAAINARAKES